MLLGPTTYGIMSFYNKSKKIKNMGPEIVDAKFPNNP